VSACRWLFPRTDKNTHREIIVQGKKPVPTKKQNWVPIKDNPSGIGTSTVFVAPKKTIAPVVLEVHSQQQKETLEVHVQQPTLEAQNIAQQQHETFEDPIHHSTVLDDDLAQQDGSDIQQNLGAVTLNKERSIEDNIEQDFNDTAADIPPSPTATDNGNIDASQHSFSMPLINVTDTVTRTALVDSHEPILTQVVPLDVNSIRADPEATVDPTLQKNLDFMQTWLTKVADVPFTPVLSKSQKKQLNKSKANSNYQTRSQGPLPNSQ